MSKSRGNTVSPFELFDKYGADATRWYLLSVSPAWTPTRFDEDGLIDVVSKFFGTLRNVYNFFVLYSNQDDIRPCRTQLSVDYGQNVLSWTDGFCRKYNQADQAMLQNTWISYDHMKTVQSNHRLCQLKICPTGISAEREEDSMREETDGRQEERIRHHL